MQRAVRLASPALLTLAAACEGTLLPVQVPGPGFALELLGTPGNLSGFTPLDTADGLRLAAFGGEPDGDPVLVVETRGGWRIVELPASWKGALRGGWTSASGETWLAGDAGLVLRGRGEPLARVDGARGRISGVSGRDREVFFASDAGPFHWNGDRLAALAEMASPPLTSVWADAAAAVWFTGPGGLVRWDGAALEALGPPDLALGAVVHTGSDRVLAVGGSTAAVALGYNGVRFSRFEAPESPPLRSAALAEDGALWVAGRHGYLARWDGRRWQRFETRLEDADILAVWPERDRVRLAGVLPGPRGEPEGFIGAYHLR